MVFPKTYDERGCFPRKISRPIFQERRKMKKVLLVLCGVVSLGLSASATNYTISLDNYCDIWNVTLDKGYNNFTGGVIGPKVFVWGTHDVLTRCGIAQFDTIGTKHGASAAVPPNNIYGTSQAVLDISDASRPYIGKGYEPIEFLIRVTNGCATAVYTGGTSFGGDIYYNEDTCTLGAAPTRIGSTATLDSRK
jgi:hypothetical protein